MFLFCLVFAFSLCASVYMCFVVTSRERADLLALVCGVYCKFVTFPLVSWVRCGTRLYRFLIFAPLLNFSTINFAKIFSKFYGQHFNLISKLNVGLQSLLRQGLSEPEFMSTKCII